MNVFGRYSWADFKRDGPTAFGQGGGRDFGTLGGVSQVNNQSLALGLDRTFSTNSILDVRFGFFRYKVDVLPFDFGTTPATDLGIPGLNFDDFSSGLFNGEVDNGGDYPGPGGPGNFRFGSGLGCQSLQLPAGAEREAVADRVELHQAGGQPHHQVRRRHPSRLQPARAERPASLGRASVQRRTAPAGRKAAVFRSRPSCWAT